MAAFQDKKKLLAESSFRNWVTADGSSGFKAEPGRYHLYVSLACPFASRATAVLYIKGLEDVISMTIADWFKIQEKGWHFTDKVPKCTLDTVNNCEYLKELYLRINPDYDGRITVPVLWDKQKKAIVNNESSEIMRMLNSEFNAFCKTDEQRKIDLYPETLRTEIDSLNNWIFPQINIGVYRCGFAQKQEDYDEAVKIVFDALDKLENILSKQRYLTGNQLTEADIRLFTTLLRFDLVYHGLFKCNKKKLVDYSNLWNFVRDIYQTPDIAKSVDFQHITTHYWTSMTHINPFGIIPIGPDLDFKAPHTRAEL